jgi:hypothetical protein
MNKATSVIHIVKTGEMTDPPLSAELTGATSSANWLALKAPSPKGSSGGGGGAGGDPHQNPGSKMLLLEPLLLLWGLDAATRVCFAAAAAAAVSAASSLRSPYSIQAEKLG